MEKEKISKEKCEKVSGGAGYGQDVEYVEEIEKALHDHGVLCERCGRLFLPVTASSNDNPSTVCPSCECEDK